MSKFLTIALLFMLNALGTSEQYALDEQQICIETTNFENVRCKPYLYTDTVKNRVVLNNPCLNGVTVWYRVDYPNGTWQKFKYNLNGNSHVILGHSAPLYQILNWWFW